MSHNRLIKIIYNKLTVCIIVYNLDCDPQIRMVDTNL